MDFSIRMVTDGQKATISITGLDNISDENSLQIKEHLSYAIGLALGIEKSQESCFVNESKPLADGQLQHNTIEIKGRTFQKLKDVEEEHDGVIENLEDIHFIGGDGTKTLIATKNSNEQNIENNNKTIESLSTVENIDNKIKEETIIDTSTSFDECDIILTLFVDSSKNVFNENRESINTNFNKLNTYRNNI